MYVIQRRYKSAIFGPFTTHDEATQWLEDARRLSSPAHPDLRDAQWRVVELWKPFDVTSRAA